MDPQNQRESFGSRLGFILVSAGCAIGIGNVWRFPTVTGQCGGGIFVLFYLLFLVLMGLPGTCRLLATIMSMFFLCSLAVLFSIKSRVSIEKPQTNSFSGLCAPTQAKISSVRSRAIFISPSCFLTLSAATVAGR